MLRKEALVQVAAYFQVLSEPTRLQILNLLRVQERSVGELAQLCGFSSANISRHLAMLTQHGLVARETRGNIARQFERAAGQRAAFGAAPAREG